MKTSAKFWTVQKQLSGVIFSSRALEWLYKYCNHVYNAFAKCQWWSVNIFVGQCRSEHGLPLQSSFGPCSSENISNIFRAMVLGSDTSFRPSSVEHRTENISFSPEIQNKMVIWTNFSLLVLGVLKARLLYLTAFSMTKPFHVSMENVKKKPRIYVYLTASYHRNFDLRKNSSSFKLIELISIFSVFVFFVSNYIIEMKHFYTIIFAGVSAVKY